MQAKRPSQIRSDLETAKTRVNTLVGVLKRHEAEQRWGLGDECSKAAQRLEKLLEEHKTPGAYIVAVVGRFKAGKSSLVNALLGSSLTGVDNQPETAAITMFRAGPGTVAHIKFIDRESWEKLKNAYDDDPVDPLAHRIENWITLEKAQKRRTGSEAQKVYFANLERYFARPGGYTDTIRMGIAHGVEAQQQAEDKFRGAIREFTRGSNPHHCLVESITIETQSDLLGEGVTLIDTPGLDDTERFRVHLTEQGSRCGRGVVSHDISRHIWTNGKDFIQSLLQKVTIRQLIFALTRVDSSYRDHVNDAKDNRRTPDTFAKRIEDERVSSMADRIDAG